MPEEQPDDPRVLRVVRSRRSLAEAYEGIPMPAVRSARASRAAVFTMGALHDGHAALIREARREVGPKGHVTVTIFVNPLQFGAGEDLAAYPRPIQDDLALCADLDVDLVFVPPAKALYPDGDPQVRVEPGPLGSVLEGAIRPGHFSGVLTVVLKLLLLTAPQACFFGEKDYQQLVLVRRMVRDLDLRVKVHSVPTVREPDGLARSSRNRYLDAHERLLAAAVPEALAAGVTAAELGRRAEAVVGAAEVVLQEAGITADYVALTDPDLQPAPLSGPSRLLLAARVGSTRILDNTPLTLRG